MIFSLVSLVKYRRAELFRYHGIHNVWTMDMDIDLKVITRADKISSYVLN